MDYQETLEYLYTKLPMFTRDGASAFNKNLDNTLALCDLLDQPQNKFKSIHVAGTNGKGSSSHMLASVFQCAGYTTGLYTSPHLIDFRERIQINGQMISQQEIVDFVAHYRKAIERIQPSFFELTVAIAFDFFAKNKVDLAIIEVGLGGSLDSTNIIQPELSVITNISLDHTNLLGNTLEEIALQKAGIIKKNTPVIIGERHAKSDPIFEAFSSQVQAPILFAEDSLELKNIHRDLHSLTFDVWQNSQLLFPNLVCDLNGSYQIKNIRTVITTLLEAKKLNYNIQNEAIYYGLAHIKEINHLAGRWQCIQKTPLTIVDTGHNEAGILQVLENINATPHEHLHIVIGMVKDKDVSTLLQLLPKNASYYFCAAALPRALPAATLQETAERYQLNGTVHPSVWEAYQSAQQKAHTQDLVFVGGSTFIVAEVLIQLAK